MIYFLESLDNLDPLDLKPQKNMNEQRKQKTLNILTWINEILHVITALFKRKHTA